MRRPLIAATIAGLVGALLVPGQVPSVARTAPAELNRAETTGAWIAREAVDGSLPGPATRYDWGLTASALFALYASGVGETAAKRMTGSLAAHAGEFLGPDLYRDKRARIAGSAAALLNVAVVTGSDPHAFGRGRYTGRGTYDMRQEVLDLVAPSGSKQPGRLRDRGTGRDSTNLFGQSLAVIGLARSGGDHEAALTFLRSQQCAAGYFRMTYNDGKSCNAARGVPDIDGTAIAVQAMLTARANGTDGLDGAIARASGWLRRVQRPDGSFGGVGTSEPPNANSTGLAAQSLHATGATGAYERARDWVAERQVSPVRAARTQVSKEVGAIAYDPASLAKARRSGIDDNGRDEWRRSTVQAVFAFSPVSFATLGDTPPKGDPRVLNASGPTDDGNDDGNDETEPPDDDQQTGPPEDDSTTDPPDDEPTDEPDRESEDDADEPGGEQQKPTQPTRPTARLASFIADQLVDGTHIEVRDRGKLYVDYDLTADAVLALRVLGERPDAARSASEFLLSTESVDAYAYGKPYESKGAAYAEPLAKLSLIAGWLPTKRATRATSSYADELARLQNDDGGFDDTGEQADVGRSTERQSWSALALRAAGRDADSDAALEPIREVQCDDGAFGTDLTQTDCAAGEVASTAMAVQALNATRESASAAYAPASATEAHAPDGSDPLVRAASYLYDYGSVPDVRPASTGNQQWSTLAAVAAGKQALGLDATYLADRMGQLLRNDGGVAGPSGTKAADRAPSEVEASIGAAPAVAGRSLLSAKGSALTPAVRVPVGVDSTEQAAPSSDAADDPLLPGWMVYALAGLLAVVLLLAAVVLAQRIVQSPRGDRS
ncbi:hypothetical protein MU582_20265 [Nocardioidaceae bacterium SCSIO 66511]|nr:hypothetical protein MU582_20265 [Nocardioidaceae bacterium SCSIO 66511]